MSGIEQGSGMPGREIFPACFLKVGAVEQWSFHLPRYAAAGAGRVIGKLAMMRQNALFVKLWAIDEACV
ncbi:MAG: hypothetical protein PUG05_02385 [Galactobacillus timonensis]|nr:hypothetical protein [Galactobacillus timonensis]